MSELPAAVDQIYAHLMSGYENWPDRHKERISPKVRADAEELYEIVAHALAEEQREYLRNQGYDTTCVCGSCSACLSAEYIDLIDPKVDEADARKPVWDGGLLIAAVGLAASFGWRTISVRRLLGLMHGDRRHLPKKGETGR